MTYQPFNISVQQKGKGFAEFLETVKKTQKKKCPSSLGIVGGKSINTKKKVDKTTKTKKNNKQKPKLCQSYALRNSKYNVN